MIPPGLVLLSLEIERTDWGMVLNLLEAQTHPTNWALVGLAQNGIEGLFYVGTDGCNQCECLSHVCDLLYYVLLLTSQVEIVREVPVYLGQFLQEGLALEYLDWKRHVHDVLARHDVRTQLLYYQLYDILLLCQDLLICKYKLEPVYPPFPLL